LQLFSFAARQQAEHWNWGCVSAVYSEGRTIWVADADRDDGKRFIVHAVEKLTAFLELEAAVRNRQSTPATEKQERDSPPEIPLVS
jgi:hypothetical protein